MQGLGIIIGSYSGHKGYLVRPFRLVGTPSSGYNMKVSYCVNS